MSQLETNHYFSFISSYECVPLVPSDSVGIGQNTLRVSGAMYTYADCAFFSSGCTVGFTYHLWCQRLFCMVAAVVLQHSGHWLTFVCLPRVEVAPFSYGKVSLWKAIGSSNMVEASNLAMGVRGARSRTLGAPSRAKLNLYRWSYTLTKTNIFWLRVPHSYDSGTTKGNFLWSLKCEKRCPWRAVWPLFHYVPIVIKCYGYYTCFKLLPSLKTPETGAGDFGLSFLSICQHASELGSRADVDIKYRSKCLRLVFSVLGPTFQAFRITA